MSAATSPSGESHPGSIENIDKVHGRSWIDSAADVPQSIGWVEVGDRWEAVVRIEVTGQEGRLEITKYGRDGRMLETTVQAPPRPEPGPEPEPEPVPTPDEGE